MIPRLFHYSILLPLSYLPYSILYKLSDVLYLIFYYLIDYRKKIVTKNLELTLLASPGMPVLGFWFHDFTHFLVLRQKTSRKRFWDGAQKKVPESAGLVGACRGLMSDLSTAWLLEAATAADFD